jgi:hypothetical protein
MLKSGAVNSEFHGESIGATFRTITKRNQKLRSNRPSLTFSNFNQTNNQTSKHDWFLIFKKRSIIF